MTQRYLAEIAQEWQALTGNTPPSNLLEAYYPRVDASDFNMFGARVLAATAYEHAETAKKLTGDQPVIDIRNPNPEDADFTGNRTVIDLVSIDHRYLLSSIVADLSGSGHAIRSVHHPQLVINRTEDFTVVSPADVEHISTETSALPIISSATEATDDRVESWIHIEIDRLDKSQFGKIKESLLQIVEFVKAAEADRDAMAGKAREIAQQLRAGAPADDLRIEASEAAELLEWLDGRFAFMGYREYALEIEDDVKKLIPLPQSALGVSSLRETKSSPLTRAVADHATDRHVLVLTKANSRSKILRRGFMDYIGIKTFDANGNIVGEKRFVGLFTPEMYNASVLDIPIVKSKAEWILRSSGLARHSHSGDELLGFLETFPRDDLFHAPKEEILDVAQSVINLQERHEATVFIRRDMYERYVSVLVYVPRDLYDTSSRKRIEKVLTEKYNATSIDFDVRLSDSALARLHFVVRVAATSMLPPIDSDKVAERIRGAVRSWDEDVAEFLSPVSGKLTAAQAQRGSLWAGAFPPSYQDEHTPHDAVADVARFEAMSGDDTPFVRISRPEPENLNEIRLALYRFEPANLSSILPYMANLGAEVTDEKPYELTLADGSKRYIYDFGLAFQTPVATNDFARLEDAFLAGWTDKREFGRMDKLIVSGLSWQEVALLRGFSHYLRQAGFSYSDAYLAETFTSHPEISKLLVELFNTKFDPDFAGDRDAAIAEASERVTEALGTVASLDADRVLRSVAELIHAIVRTNVFQHGPDSTGPAANVFKLLPTELDFVPKPKPQFEMFVYSPLVEGVHLRFGSVARGGLRWSDRRDDFRTEVLGLVKAQMVKNALIVPTGAKGGFFPKRLPDPAADRQGWAAAGQAAYELFIGALLDVTDNLVTVDGEHQVVHPERTVIHDADDTYLVVAADKGTARFSDVANSIAQERGFWLGDAFASGGSNGYDHKAMGITSRGAWKSVERHFRELGVNTATDSFTAVGIGDMSGDVFGNGMQRTEAIRLVAAFDHRDIFIDPNPDAKAAFAERVRLFELPRSSWQDYDKNLISAGGGVFSRQAKSIEISPEAAEALGMRPGQYPPSEVIRAVLTAPVDLLYNGGIGTYIKAQSESHAEVGDRANDAIRIDGAELRARVVGEGGNLGATQLGRIEAALAGVRINTDAVDNSAGVDCSDHEVNIKLLLRNLIDQGQVAPETRNDLLMEMTDEVAQLVLHNNYSQNVVLGEARNNAVRMNSTHRRLIKYLEKEAHLDRAVEFLPEAKTIQQRLEHNQALVSPELAVLLAYVKMDAADKILASNVPGEAFMQRFLQEYFPQRLSEPFAEHLDGHPLAREIATARLVNTMVDRGGLTYLFRLQEETGAPIEHIARVFVAVNDIFNLHEHFAAINGLDNVVDSNVQVRLHNGYIRLLDRASRWMLNQAPTFIDVEEEVKRYRETVQSLAAEIPHLLRGADRAMFDDSVSEYVRAGVSQEIAQRAAGLLDEFALLDVVQTAQRINADPMELAEVHFGVVDLFRGAELLDRIGKLDRSSRWNSLARGSMRDDYYQSVDAIVAAVMNSTDSDQEDPADRADQRIAQWQFHNDVALRKVRDTLDEVLELEQVDQAPLSVVLRMLGSLVRSTAWQSETA